MKKFNSTELQKNPSTVFNEVQKSGKVKIAPRGREEMFLISKDHLDELLKQQEKK